MNLTKVAQLRLIYDDYRTAKMNCLYYAHRLRFHQRWNRFLEIVLALGTSGTIATWAIWQKGMGEYVWTFFAGLVTLLAIIKPILQLSTQIERCSKSYVGYLVLYYDLQNLVNEIEIQKDVNEKMVNTHKSAKERKKDLALDDEQIPKERLLQKCYDRVNREIPVTSLWFPSKQ